MPIPMTAPAVLDREYLTIRAKILEVAASLDRLDRAEGEAAGDPRLSLIQRGLEALGAPGADRAERVQMIFSLPFDEQWRAELKVNPPE